MNSAIKLPVLYLNGKDVKLTELGVKNEDDCIPEVKMVYFYQITAISTYIVDDKQMTCIHTPSQEFICPMHIEEVKTEIEKL